MDGNMDLVVAWWRGVRRWCDAGVSDARPRLGRTPPPRSCGLCGYSSWVAAQALVGGRASARECGGCGTALRHTQRSSPLPRSPWPIAPPVPPSVPARCSARQSEVQSRCLSPGAHLVHQFRDGRGCTGGIGRREGQGDGRDDEQPCHRQRRHVNELCGRLGHRSR